MAPILDPREGDIEDDSASTKKRSLLQLAGSMLAEISLPKLIVVWLLLIGFPGLLLGSTPLLASIWIHTLLPKALLIFAGIWSAVAVLFLIGLGWFGGRRLLRLGESSFWSLNALMVKPAYVLFREGFRHLAEAYFVRGSDDAGRARVRVAAAVASGIVICGLAVGLIALVWPVSRWTGSVADLAAPIRLIPAIIANAVIVVSAYLAVAALAWAIADTAMGAAVDFRDFAVAEPGQRLWRVAHLSDLHIVGERYGFRIESGRAGPHGNAAAVAALDALAATDAAERLDLILITGDLTDAGRSAEWAEFMTIMAAYPGLAGRIVAVPGNHDVNVVDRANPARMEWPLSPTKRLRRLRTLSALEVLQGKRMHVVDQQAGRIGATLSETLRPHEAGMASFADTGSSRLWGSLAHLWPSGFPLVLPPDTDDGLGVIALDSNAETHFSFTNALGLVTVSQMRAVARVIRQFPRAHWIVALHHHVIEYPRVDTPFFERIGTALINGTWFIRALRGLTDRAVIMHGHRHIDWIGQCAGLPIISAGSAVMKSGPGQDPYFNIHTFASGADGRVRLLPPRRVYTQRP